jgi:hypothetical protein
MTKREDGQALGWAVAADDKRKKGTRARQRRAGSYEPVRGPRLKGASEPPPPASVPPAIGADDPTLFGAAVEDGLRMIAALETMPSLEPDFGDDLVGEASVTIVERATCFDEPSPLHEARLPPALPQGRRQHEALETADVDAENYAAYRGPVDEAVVEIFASPAAAPAPREPQPN